MQIARNKVVWSVVVIAALWFAFLYPFEIVSNKSFWDRLADASHLPLFAVIAVGGFLFLSRSKGRYLKAFVLSGATAVLVEMIQPLTGRSASFVDLVNGILGGAIGVIGLYVWKEKRGYLLRSLHATVTVLLFTLVLRPVWNQYKALLYRAKIFPRLASFEDRRELFLWAKERGEKTGAVQLTLSSDVHIDGAQSLRVETSAGSYLGVSYRAESQDWRGFSQLSFAVYNPGETFSLHLRIDDSEKCKEFNDRFNRTFILNQGWNGIHIPLSEIETGPKNRKLELNTIRRAMFFVGEREEVRVFFLDAVQLK